MKAVCLLTGGAGFLGGELCKLLSADYHLISVYHQKIPVSGSKLFTSVANPDDEEILFIQADLTKKDDVRRVVEVALARFGKIDHIIHCAADIKFHGKIREIFFNGDYFQSQFTINTLSPMLLTSLVYEECWKDVPDVNKEKNRSVVNISSMSGLVSTPAPQSQVVYAASKAAYNILSAHLSAELVPYHVRVNCVCPASLKDPVYLKKVLNTIRSLLTNNESDKIISSF